MKLPLAVFSPCRKYRYLLTRQWDDSKPYMAFIGLNPSTADETKDDATIRRCIGFAKRWGYGGLIMGNIFAYRATNPKDMKRVKDPVGKDNDRALEGIGRYTKMIVLAYGNHGEYKERGDIVNKMYSDYISDAYNWKTVIYHLGLTNKGFPKHPLYLKNNAEPIEYINLRSVDLGINIQD